MGERLDTALAGAKRARLQYQKPNGPIRRPKAKEKSRSTIPNPESSLAEVPLPDRIPAPKRSLALADNNVAKAVAKQAPPKRRNLRPWRLTSQGIVYRRQ